MILKLKQKKKHDKKGKLQGLEEESLDLPALSHGHIAQAQSLELLFSSVLSAGVCFSGSLGFLIYWDPVQFSPGGLMNWLLLGGGGTLSLSVILFTLSAPQLTRSLPCEFVVNLPPYFLTVAPRKAPCLHASKVEEQQVHAILF